MGMFGNYGRIEDDESLDLSERQEAKINRLKEEADWADHGRDLRESEKRSEINTLRARVAELERNLCWLQDPEVIKRRAEDALRAWGFTASLEQMALVARALTEHCESKPPEGWQR
jgi:cell division protein FtsB